MGGKKFVGFVMVLVMLASIPAFAAESSQLANQPQLLTLAQALELAQKNNKQIQEADKSVTIAEDALKEAEAGYWPTVGFQVAHASSDVAQYEFGLYDYEKQKFTAGVSATLPLYTGGTLGNKVKLAQIQLDAVKEDERQAKQQLVFHVKQDYYNVWLAEQVLRVQQASYDNLNQHVNRVQNLYKAGTASKFDLLQAEVQRDTLKPKVILAQNQLVLAKLELATMIGFPKDRPYRAEYDVKKLQMPESVTRELRKVLDEAYQNRPDIHQIGQLVAIKKVQTDMAESGYKPYVDLTASYGGKNKDIAFSDWDKAWELTLSVKSNIFDRTIKTQVDQAKGDEELTAIKEADLRDQIRLEAEQALQNLEVGIETTRANQGNIDLAQESLRLTQTRFDNGMATTMDIMDAQLALDQALNGYYQGVVSYLIADAKLDLVVGKD